MHWANLRAIFCCCARDAELQDITDETTFLIQPVFERRPSITDSVIEYRKRHERLNMIVRATEGKMVNIGSKVPFNLHNRVLPPERSETLSRSASGSLDLTEYSDLVEYTAATYKRHHRERRRAEMAKHASPHLPSYDHDGYHSRPRSVSPVVGIQPRYPPILNTRLVGFKGETNRGRPRGRAGYPGDNDETSKTLVERQRTVTASQADGESGTGIIPGATQFVGDIVFNWGD